MRCPVNAYKLPILTAWLLLKFFAGNRNDFLEKYPKTVRPEANHTTNFLPDFFP